MPRAWWGPNFLSKFFLKVMKFGSVKISLKLCIFNFFSIFCLLISCSLLHLKTVTNFDNQLIIDPLLSSLSHLSQFICFLVHFLLIVLYPSFTICLDFGELIMVIIKPFSDPCFLCNYYQKNACCTSPHHLFPMFQPSYGIICLFPFSFTIIIFLEHTFIFKSPWNAFIISLRGW